MSGSIWHFSQYAKLSEQSLLEICINLCIHLNCFFVALHCCLNLGETIAILIREMQNEIIVQNSIEFEFGIKFWPSQRSSIKTIQLRHGTVNRSLLNGCLCVYFLRIVAFRKKTVSEDWNLFSHCNSVSFMMLNTCHGTVVRDSEVVLRVFGQVKNVSRCSFTVPADLNRQIKLVHTLKRVICCFTCSVS